MWSSWVFGSSQFEIGSIPPLKRAIPKRERAPIGWGLPGIIYKSQILGIPKLWTY